MIFEDVHDQTTLIAFIEELRSELADPIRFGGWENATLDDFFEAMQAWATDTVNIPVNPWRLAATLIFAGTNYE